MNIFYSIHFLEVIATVVSFINIFLAARAHISNWVFGIISTLLYLVVFFQVKLYADMSLQGVFFILQFYGLYQWLYGGENHHSLTITKAPRLIIFYAFILTTMLFTLIAFLLWHYTDSTTVYVDAFTTALSLVAQWMMCRKWLEHWYLWIIVDIVSIEMYINKNLYLTSILYASFLVLCILGYMTWKKGVCISSEALTPMQRRSLELE